MYNSLFLFLRYRHGAKKQKQKAYATYSFIYLMSWHIEHIMWNFRCQSLFYTWNLSSTICQTTKFNHLLTIFSVSKTCTRIDLIATELLFVTNYIHKLFTYNKGWITETLRKLCCIFWAIWVYFWIWTTWFNLTQI